MSYKIIFSKDAFREIKRLDSVARNRLGKKIKEYSQDPKSYAKRLINPDIGSYRWRVGNYRVIFDIEDKIIVILRVGHRREIYNK